MKTTVAVLALSTLLSFSAMAAKKGDSIPKVNVNQASSEQLDKGLVGVGPRIAMEIVRHRDLHGPYQSREDLDKVKYVGGRMLDKNKNRIVFD